MRDLHRVILLVATLGLVFGLAGCENFDTDKLDFLGLNTKKPLPGDRKAVFPEGVPGVAQGIPPEYLKNNIQQQTGAAVDDVTQTPPVEPDASPASASPKAQTATAEPAPPALRETESAPKVATKPKTATNPKPKHRTVKHSPENAPASPEQNAQGQPSAPSPEQAQAQPAPQSTQQAQSQSSWPEPQNTMAPWPSAPPPGTFSR